MPDFPNWPAPVVEPKPVSPIDTELHATIQDARAAGATEGTILQAPLAPAKGPIDAPAESMVVVAVKSFWQSPTIKWARNIIGTALLAVLGVFATSCMAVWGKGQSIFTAGAIDWAATEVSAEVAAGMIIGAAILAYKKTKDNNPIQQG